MVTDITKIACSKLLRAKARGLMLLANRRFLGCSETNRTLQSAVFNVSDKIKLWMAMATLIGTTVGAGILALPYVISRSGFLIGLVEIITLGLASILLNLFVGEIILRTKKNYQLSGYVGKYLGPWGKHLMAFSLVIGIYGALIAYLIGEGEVLKTVFGGNSFFYSLLFFVFAAGVVFFGIKALGKAEIVMTTLMVAAVLLLGIFSFEKIEADNLNIINPLLLLFPYGAILFAFMSATAIPEMKEELHGRNKLLKKAIIFGGLTPIVIYLVFSAVILGIVGPENFSLLQENQRIATVALEIFSSGILSLLINLFAAFSMGTAFLALGYALWMMLHRDYGIKKLLAYFIALLPPLLIFFLNLTTFISVINFIGAFIGLFNILIILAFWQAKKKGERKPEYQLGGKFFIGGILILLFLMGALALVLY